MVKIMRTAPTQCVFCTFRNHSLELHLGSHSPYLVAVYKRRVAQHLRCVAKILLNLFALSLYFGFEAVFISQRSQAVRIRFGKKFHTTCLGKLLYLLYYFRCILFQTLYAHTRKAECHLEVTVAVFYHLQQRVERRNVASLHNICNAAFVFVVVVIIMIGSNVEETITTQVYNLMYLEI